MSLRLYMDVHVRRAVTRGLQLRGVDVLTAQEDGSRTMRDPQLLDRAMGLGRVLFTNDADFLREAARRQQTGVVFAGLVYAHRRVSNRQCIDDLELLAKVEEPADFLNRVEYLPL